MFLSESFSPVNIRPQSASGLDWLLVATQMYRALRAGRKSSWGSRATSRLSATGRHGQPGQAIGQGFALRMCQDDGSIPCGIGNVHENTGLGMTSVSPLFAGLPCEALSAAACQVRQLWDAGTPHVDGLTSTHRLWNYHESIHIESVLPAIQSSRFCKAEKAQGCSRLEVWTG